MKEIGIGLLGFGTVGAGVVEGLQRNNHLLEERLGFRLALRRIADLDLTSDRGVRIDPSILTTDAESLVTDSSVDIVIELIGGSGIARKLVMQALSLGKPVVTANKKLLAEYGSELYALAADNGADLYFGASVGGGIPIIRSLREGLSANAITGIQGILNGTCNYILTEMETKGLAFGETLAEAQRLGFAEADPALDIDGYDTAHKAVILASLAYGSPVSLHAVHVEGIRGLDKMDIDYAAGFGYRIKLLAVIQRDGDAVEVRVHPTLVPADAMLSSVNGVFNAVMVESDLADRTLYYGRGAGRLPTASTVLGDVVDVARNLAGHASLRVPACPPTGETLSLKPMADIRTRYYLRLCMVDQPGVFSKVAGVLGDRGISIKSVLQKGTNSEGLSPVVIMTHEAREADMDAALEGIDALQAIHGQIIRLRVAS
jgi:homoserine dehydrogenase